VCFAVFIAEFDRTIKALSRIASMQAVWPARANRPAVAFPIHDVKLDFHSLSWVWSGKSLNGGDFYAGWILV
jgi:hypothetical protein